MKFEIKYMQNNTFKFVNIFSIIGVFVLGVFPEGLMGQNNNTLFKLLPPSKTGVHFENIIEDKRKHNILIYSNYYGGAGVAVSDLNNDGLQDLIFAGNLVGDQIYLNQGGMDFKEITQQVGIKDNGGWTSGIVVGDVNNDGWKDFYLCRELYDENRELRRNKLYLNNGDAPENNGIPTFTERAAEYGLDDNERTRHATFLDYNKDGLLDLFILNQPPNPGNFSDLYGAEPQPRHSPRLFRNNGNGNFEDVTKQAGLLKAGYPNAVSASDINNDGWTDLYLANDYEIPDFMYMNNGDGTFTNTIDQSMQHISYFGMGVDIADINNDGLLDIMVLDMVAEGNYRLKTMMGGMGPETFRKRVEEGGHRQYMFNTLQLNNGQPYDRMLFSETGHLNDISNTDWSWTNLVADFDNDGWKDIYVTNGLMRDIRNADADKEFSRHIENIAHEFINNNPNAGTVTIWEIMDLQNALSIVPSVKTMNYVYKNDGDLTFTKKMEDWGMDQKVFSHGAAYADLDNDGDLDLVVSNVNDTAFIYQNRSRELNRGNHYLRVKLTDSVDHEPIFGSRVTINNDGKEQLYEFTNVRGMYSVSENIAHFGIKQSGPIDKVTIKWPDGKITSLQNVETDQALTLDRNAVDRKQIPAKQEEQERIFEKNDKISFVHQENDFDDFEKQPLLPYKMSQFGPALASGDVNANGLDDVYTGGAAGQAGELWIQQGSGNFIKENVAAFENDALYEDINAVFLDVNGDGNQDLYVVSGGNAWEAQSAQYQDRLYLNKGEGNFERSNALPEFFESGSCVKPFDFDQDGDLDLFIGGRHVPWQYPSPTSSRILENQNGNFQDVTNEVAGDLVDIGMVTDAVWVDFNEDGYQDLILTGEWMPLTFVTYDGEKFENVTGQYGIENSTGWWFSLEKGDMDGDGDQDLIGGNLGLNFKYQTSPEAPFEVFYDDFDDNGSGDVVLSYYNFGKRYPVRRRPAIVQKMPSLRQKFPDNTSFAEATLEDVFGKQDLQNALHYEAHNFASAYFENGGKGSFTMKKLPSTAQISSVNDILTDDFNDDGYLDILLAGNLYPVEVSTIRNDASIGLLLKGDGKGNFTPVPARESGFAVPYDIKNLVEAAFSRGSFIFGGANDAEIQGFNLNKK